jgi:hypothetical protein
MLRFFIVRNILLFTARFLLSLILLLIIFSLFYVLFLWGGAFNEEVKPDAALIGPAFFHALERCFIPVLLLTAFYHLLWIVRHPDKRLVTLVLLPAFVFLALSFGFRGIHSAGRSLTAPDSLFSCKVNEKVLHNIEGSYLYIEDSQDVILDTLIIVDPAEKQNIMLIDQAAYDPSAAEIIVPVAGQSFALTASGAAYCSMFRAPGFVKAFFRDAEYIRDYFTSIPALFNVQFLLTLAGISFFCGTSWFLARFSKWPLLNLVLVLCAYRFLVFIFYAVKSSFFYELTNSFLDGPIVELLPAVVLISLGGVFLLLSFLTLPFAQWRKDAGYE